jgi:transcription antitermination factor NusG
MCKWYALYTKPHAEMGVTAALAARGIATYLPTVPVWRARRRRLEAEPLFACYSFAQVDLAVVGLSAITWIPGLRAVVCSQDAPVELSEAVISHIRQRVAEMSTRVQRSRFEVGSRVRIVEGPMKDLEAVFDGTLSGEGRAQILLQVLGRLTRCEIREEWLARAG